MSDCEKLADTMIELKGYLEEIYEFPTLDFFLKELAMQLIANGVTLQQWIPVTERLPEDGQSVLTCKNGICDIQIYEKRRNGWLCKGWFWSMATVTHWMPLTQPPKGELQCE